MLDDDQDEKEEEYNIFETPRIEDSKISVIKNKA